MSNNGAATENSSDAAAPADGTSGPEAAGASKRTVRDAVTPLAHMTYSDQLEHKEKSVAQLLKKLVRSISCPSTIFISEATVYLLKLFSLILLSCTADSEC